MIKTISIFFLNILLFPSIIFGQKPIGIICTDFKINNKNRQEGVDFRRSVESILSNLKYPPEIIDREKIQAVLVKIQDEINLNRDLNIDETRELKAAQVDYLMYGNFDKRLTSVTYDLQIECIKISGDNAFSKKAFPIISFTEDELSNSQIFRKKLSDMFNEYAFTEDFGIIENIQLNKIYKRLDEKDIQIKNLDSSFKNLESDSKEKSKALNSISGTMKNMEDEISIKDQQIKNLNFQIIGIKDYSNIARLNLNGLEKVYGPEFSGWQTELYNLMNSVIVLNKSKMAIKTNDTAMSILKTVIDKYPNFPFGYYGMCVNLIRKGDSDWKMQAIKAIKILEVTTTIEGHKPVHDEVLAQLNVFINLDKQGYKPMFNDKGEIYSVKK